MEQSTFVYLVLVAALVSFVTNFIRYDLTALLALMALAFARVIPFDEVFQGFSNSAVITVGAVLVISRALERAGLVNALEGLISRVGARCAAKSAGADAVQCSRVLFSID